MGHTHHHQKKLLTRVRRIKGQTEALERALATEKDCFDILQQIASIRGAINGLMAEVIEGHVEEHIAAPKSMSDRVKGSDELMQILRSYIR